MKMMESKILVLLICGLAAAGVFSGRGVSSHLAPCFVLPIAMVSRRRLGLNAGDETSDNFVYGAFGEEFSGEKKWPFKYTGRWGGYSDGRLEFVLNWNRWYGSTPGRWLGRDPIEVAGGINFYSNVGNNAPSFHDPSGLCCSKDFKTCFGNCVDKLISPIIPIYLMANIAASIPYTPYMKPNPKFWTDILKWGTPVMAAWMQYLAWTNPSLYANILKIAGMGSAVGAAALGWILGTILGCATSCGLDSCSY